MASRLKERGGGGGKVMALQLPHRSALDGTPQGKLAARRAPPVVKEHPGRTPISGKENVRAVSRGKIAPGVAQRMEGAEAGEKVQAAPVGARWSTSSMPRGKSSNPSDFARLMADFRARGGSQGRHSVAAVPVIEGKEKVVAREARNVESPAICRVAGRFQQPRKIGASKDSTVASTNVQRLADVGKSSIAPSSNLRSVSRPRGSNLEKIGEKTLIKPVDNSIVTGNGDQIQKKSLPRRKECPKVVDSFSNGKIKVAEDLESSKRGSVRTVFLEEGKQSVLLAAASESRDESDPLALHLSQSRRMQSNGVHAKITNLADAACIKSSSTATVDNVTVSKILIRKESDGGKAPATSIKLHEKLAYLEGKVQKIASDIKRTKDMLESNDPAASKLLLSNIQSKISGIEEVVTHVIGSVDLESKPYFPTKDETSVTTGLRDSAKEFNPEELEARFFPHHKLLKSRTSTVSEILVKDRSLSLAEENPIALEFLAALEVEKSNPNESVEIQHTGGSGSSASSSNENLLSNAGIDSRVISFASMLVTQEKIEDFDDQENKPASIPQEETEDPASNQWFEIGSKSSTGGWFVSEGEAALLAHSDGTCSYFDIANNEGKSEFNPPVEISSNMWGDCWLIRAPGVDGCAGRYVVAASAGNSLGSGFCSWDFYSKKVSAFRIDESKSTSTTASLSSAPSLSRTVLAPLPNTPTCAQQWWYRPCGPLLVAASSGLREVNAFDIRDGEMVMTWSLVNPAASMEYSSPLQWRSRGKVVIAESESIRLWDVNALSPQPLLSIAAGKKVNALHVNNTDAELGGGVRQRISSSEVDGNDGSFSTDEEVNVVDLRLPSGIGLKMAKKPGVNARESIFSRGDSIYLGCAESTPSSSAIHQFSLRKGKMGATYKLPKVNAHVGRAALTQVWGNSDLAMGVYGMGLFVFDDIGGGGAVDSRQVFGPDDLCCPSFDFLGSRALLISRDRPAMWRYLY